MIRTKAEQSLSQWEANPSTELASIGDPQIAFSSRQLHNPDHREGVRPERSTLDMGASFLKAPALRDIDMDVKHSLAAQSDMAQLLLEPQTLRGDDIWNSRTQRVQPSDCRIDQAMVDVLSRLTNTRIAACS